MTPCNSVCSVQCAYYCQMCAAMCIWQVREDALKKEVVNLRQELQQQNSQLQNNQQIIVALQVNHFNHRVTEYW